MSQEINTSKKFNIKKFLYKHRFLLIFLVFNVFVHRKILLFDTSLAYGDVSPFPEKAQQTLNQFFYSWQEAGFGRSRQQGLIFSLIQSLFVFVFRSPTVAQKVYILVLPTIGFLSFLSFLKYIFKKHNEALFNVVSFLYAFSPISLGEFNGGTLYSTILIFAMFPILYKSTLKLLKSPSIKRVVIHGMLISLFTSLYMHIIVIYFMTLIALFIYDLIKIKLKAIKKWFNFVYSSIIAVALNPILFFTSLGILKSSSRGEQTKSFVDYSSQFLGEMSVTYKSGKFFSALRLASFGAFKYHFEYFWTYPFYLVILFVIIFSIYGLLKKYKKDKILLISLINYAAVTLFIYFTHKQWLFPLFRKVPVLFMFRNPSKLIYISTFFFYTTVVYSIKIFLNLKIKTAVKYVSLSCLFIIHLVYIWPIFLGDRALSVGRKKNYVIPKHFYEIVYYLKGRGEIEYHRNTWLPIGHDMVSTNLVWLDRRKLDAQIGIREFSGSAFEHDMLETVYGAVIKEDANVVINALKASLVDYLILHKAYDYYEGTNFNYENLQKVLNSKQIIKTTDKYDIYYIRSKTPLIYSPETLTTSNIGESGNYYLLSRANPDEVQTLVPNDKVNEFQIPAVDQNAFLFSHGSPKMSTNVEWYNHWTWKTPTVYPNIPERPTRETETATYLEDSMSALAEISEYLKTQRNIPNSEVQTLLNSYSNILSIYINFVQNIPPERFDNNTVTYLIKLYLYVERSLENLRQADLLVPEIESQYESFAKTFEPMTLNDCLYEFCFNFDIGKPTSYNMEIYDINKETLKNNFYINGEEYKLGGHTVSNKWTEISNVFFEPGNYKAGINLNLNQKSYYYDKDSNTITIPNDETLKYKNSFLYSFDEDVFLTVTYTPAENSGKEQSYLVWQGTLASTKNSNFCYKKENGKCYRYFFSQLQPTNSYKDVKFTFFKNVVIEKSGTNEVRDFEVVEYKRPFLYLKDSTQNLAPKPKLNPPDIEFEKINPTKYKIRIKSITEDFMLVFNQSYNTKWILQDSNKQRIADERHFKVNYFANAWWIKTADLGGASEAELDLIFYPQRYVWLSLTSTIITLSVSIYIVAIRKPSHVTQSSKTKPASDKIE